MKKYIIAIGFLAIVLPAAWYLISPIWNIQELREESPLSEGISQKKVQTEKVPEAKSEQMALIEKEQFEKSMEKAKTQPITEMTDTTPTQAAITARGLFVPQAHEVSGNALLIERNGVKTLRFENFETINGPDLHIYLATDTTANDVIDLGAIRATKGNINYPLPADVDIKKYDTVLVWCVPFRVLFSSAELR